MGLESCLSGYECVIVVPEDLNWLPASLSGITQRNQIYLASLTPALLYTYRFPHIQYTQLKIIKNKKLHLFTACMYSHIMVHVCINMNVWVCKSENILKSQFSLSPNSGFLTSTFSHRRQVYSPLIPASPDNEVFHITKGRLSSNLIYLSCFSLICKNKRQVGLGGMSFIKTNKQTRTQKVKINKQKQKEEALTLFLVFLLQEERLQNIGKNVHFHVHAWSGKLLIHSFRYLPLRRPPQAFSGSPSLPFTMLG